ncbi:MAG: UDP-3-O-acyl-N-acetylglucosamine deacetylase [Alphaproteobacteria bacterium]|nr:UDP-3-O-acyl-N-acetylglucosamine deacetylase [Alphaproteobacteria bacterium]
MASLKKTVKFSGVGIHSGAPVAVRILPSKKPGIFFKRVDQKGAPMIPAVWDRVSGAYKMNTTIRGAAACGFCEENYIETIEHLMAALFITGVTSAVIEINGPETPIMDGSAAEFIKLVKKLIVPGGRMRRIIVKRPVVAYRCDLVKRMPFWRRLTLRLHNWRLGRTEDGFVRLSPGKKGMDIRMVMDYPDKIIGRQEFDYLFDGGKKSTEFFVKNISRSRTFGRISEWEYLKKRGMGRGANEKNVIVIDKTGEGTLNRLYFPDEFVRHKIVDLIGDFYLSGGMIVGKIESVKGSHGLNNEVLRLLFADPKNYEIK